MNEYKYMLHARICKYVIMCIHLVRSCAIVCCVHQSFRIVAAGKPCGGTIKNYNAKSFILYQFWAHAEPPDYFTMDFVKMNFVSLELFTRNLITPGVDGASFRWMHGNSTIVWMNFGGGCLAISFIFVHTGGLWSTIIYFKVKLWQDSWLLCIYVA